MENFKNLKFISASENYNTPYIRAIHNINNIKKVTISVVCLGFYEFYCNGSKISKELYNVPYSQYDKQTENDVPPHLSKNSFLTETINCTNYVMQFDITESVVKGENCIGFLLAGGWFVPNYDLYSSTRTFSNKANTAVSYVIEAENEVGEVERFYSTNNAKWSKSFLIDSGVFHEEQNENEEIKNFSLTSYDDSVWENTIERNAPISRYLHCDYPLNNIIRIEKPKLILEKDNYKIYDVGRNITGFPVVLGKITKGRKIDCYYSEEFVDNDLDSETSYKQHTSFICDGRNEHCLRFTWHGFRYFKIVCDEIEKINVEQCCVVHAAVKNTSEFVCDNNILNWIYNTYVETQLQNYQCGVPTDCPHIERKGYTGDGQLLANLGILLFDSKKIYRKWLNDISDCQDEISGHVQYTAPNWIGAGGGPGGWGIAIVSVPYMYYKHYGDVQVLEEFYPKIKKYLGYLETHSEKGIVVRAEEGAWCLGDWSFYDKSKIISEGFVNTYFYVKALEFSIKIAKVLKYEIDIPAFENKITMLKEAINQKYYDEITGNYCENLQGGNAFALDIGLGDKRTIDNLVADYEDRGFLDTGIFGTEILIKVLFERNFQDLAVKLLTSKKANTYSDWMRKGATTLYEHWDGERSHNHPMFGSVVCSFYEYILGIKNLDAAFNNVVIQPKTCNDIKQAKGKISTTQGIISVEFNRFEKHTEYIVSLPKGVNGELIVENTKYILTNGVNVYKI